MNTLTNLQETQVILNRFLIKELTEDDCKVYEYTCNFAENPESGQEFREIASICYRLGVIATQLGNTIITKKPVNSDRLKSEAWEVKLSAEKILSPTKDHERRALEKLERKALEAALTENWKDKTAVDKAADGGLIWWIKEKGVELFGNGWEVHRGRKIDVNINSFGSLFLEVDLHYKFYTPWTLHEWQDEYPECSIDYVRNTYKDKNNQYRTWRYENEISEETPDSFKLQPSGQSLADYHHHIGATDEEIQSSRVVYVKSASGYRNDQIPHLSCRLTPSLTMEMLAYIAEKSNLEEKGKVQEVFKYIRKSIDTRLKESERAVSQIASRVYGLEFFEPQPIKVNAYTLTKAKLYGKKGAVDKTGDVRSKGCVKVGELKFGCLNLVNDKYPRSVEKCLTEVAENSGAEIRLGKPLTSERLPKGDLDRQKFWHDWAQKAGVRTILVISPWLSNAHKKQIRVDALKAGIATQFMLPMTKDDPYKAMNVVLGLLAKAGWQAVRLEPLDHPQAADLVIGFDTGTNRKLYYGTSAFAVLADGQSLGWEIPDVQRGERFSGEAVWQTVSSLIIRFYNICDRYPKRVLLMRDGLVQDGEFDHTIAALKEKDIEVDLIGVRKSGAGRMGREVQQDEETVYRDAASGTVVFMPEERSFLLVTTDTRGMGSVRPLRVIHEYGNGPLEVLALQTYHLTKLHPASGYSTARLPWVLHLADKSSKEFQRIEQMSILQNLDREKLIVV
jgi:Argonaute PAZ domain